MMNQKKLSKQQKKIILILGKNYDGSKQGVELTKLKRQIANLIDEPMTNSVNASVTRSLTRLKERGIIKHSENTLFSDHYMLSEEGLQIYKNLKGQKRMF